MHVCLFDIDGTLVRTGGAGMFAFHQTFTEEFGVSANDQGGVSFAGRSDRAIAMDLFAAYGLEPSAENWERFRAGYVRRMSESLPRHEGRVLPGVVTLLEELASRRDVAVGLLTGNVRETAERKLTFYGLWDHFAFGGFGDDHLDRNDIAAMALAEARVHLASNGHAAEVDGTVLVIGDTLNDIRCARSISARAIAVPTGHTPAATLRSGQPDLLVDTLEQMVPILELLPRSA